MALLDDLKAWLVSGLVADTSIIKLDEMPPTPDKVLVIMLSPGEPGYPVFRDASLSPHGLAAESPAFVCRGRSADPAEAYSLAYAAYKRFLLLGSTTINGHPYYDCRLNSPPFRLDDTESGLSQYTFDGVVDRGIA